MFSEFIKKERLRAGISLGSLSRLSGVPKATIANWDRGKEPSAENLHKVLIALGISIQIGAQTNLDLNLDERRP